MEEQLKYNEKVFDEIFTLYRFNKKQATNFVLGLENQVNILVEPAIVIDVNPLMIAVEHRIFNNCTIYTYPSFLVDLFSLKIGTRLIAKNNYENKATPGRNVLIQGTQNPRFNNVTPYIMDFMFEDFANEKITFSDYSYNVLVNKAHFSLEFDQMTFDGITKRIGGKKDENRG